MWVSQIAPRAATYVNIREQFTVHYRLRNQVPLADAAEGTVSPAGCVDVVMQATGKTLEQVVTAISEALGIEPGSEQQLVDALGDVRRRWSWSWMRWTRRLSRTSLRGSCCVRWGPRAVSGCFRTRRRPG